MNVFDSIKELKEIKSLSKHEQLVMGIIQTIDAGHLQIGDQLPSINVMVGKVGFARKTIVKAYEDLKHRGLVGSKKNKGYFIINNKTNLFVRIALIMYSFQRFQQEFYDALRNELEDKVQIDVFFHHNNDEIFKTILSNINGKYGMYIVAPIVSNSCKDVLKNISPEKLIVVDRFLDLGPDHSYVIQEFQKSTYENVQQLLPKIKKYKKTVLFFREDRDYPNGVLKAFEKFALDNQMHLEIEKKYQQGSVVKDCLYFVVSDSDLWTLIKDCRTSNFKLGKDVGVLSFNDHVVKELVEGGITTISTDFKQMAEDTAKNIRELNFSKVVVPTTLIDRDSL